MRFRRELVLPSDATNITADRQIWAIRDVVVVPRALCLYAELDRESVPMSMLRGFVSMQVARLSPFERFNSHIEFGRRHVRIWYWDTQRLLSLFTQPLPADACFVPESCLLGDADFPLVVCPLGGFEGRCRAPGGRLSSHWWAVMPTAAQWQKFSASALPPASQPMWRRSIAARSWAGVTWWQRPAPTAAMNRTSPLFVLSSLSVAAVCGLIGFRAQELFLTAEQFQRQQASIDHQRKVVSSQIQHQLKLATLAEKSGGLSAFSAQTEVVEVVACIGLAVTGSGLTVRDIDIRAGSVQGQLVSASIIELRDAQQIVDKCTLLRDITIEPSNDPKVVRLTATMLGRAQASTLLLGA